MANKPIKAVMTLQIPAGEAKPAPPLGPALGQHGVAIMDFVRAYNDQTKDQIGTIVPVQITIYEDRSFSFILRKPPISVLIKKELGLEKGSGTPNSKIVGRLTKEQISRIAEVKGAELNAKDHTAAMKIVAGAARSMGVETEPLE